MKIINNIKKNKVIYLLGAVIAALLIYDFIDINFTDNSLANGYIDDALIRLIGGVVFLYVIKTYKLKILNIMQKPFLYSLLVSLPFFAVAINNLPIIALIRGDAYVLQPMEIILLFAVVCFSVGLFEEMLFRGLLLPYFINRAESSKKGLFKAVVLSSALFGLIHILNIFYGMGAGAAVLQTGYSFLIGAMLAVLLLKTKNIWLCVIIHAVYNFCGLLVTELGGGKLWDVPTIIITTVLAVIVFVYALKMVLSLNPQEVKNAFKL